MTDAAPDDLPPDDLPPDDLIAAEYAIGLLEATEAMAIEARLSTDPVLASRVTWWREHLSALTDEAAVEPSTDLWPAIAARLPVNDNPRDVRRWQVATGGMSAIAAALLGIIALRPIPIAPPVAPSSLPVPATALPMVASVSGARGVAVAVSYDRVAARLIITPISLDAGKGDTELWVIPVGATAPVSLGVINAKRAGAHAVDARRAALVAPGATIAISREARGGSTTGSPQGPVIATGKLIRV